MILRNTSPATFTAEFEHATATPIYNSNTNITIGGREKTQVDSVRLAITTQIRIPQSELPNIQAITNNFTLPMYYTPNCKLYDRQTIEEIEVVMKGNPVIDERIWYNDKVFYITYKFNEVLSA